MERNKTNRYKQQRRSLYNYRIYVGLRFVFSFINRADGSTESSGPLSAPIGRWMSAVPTSHFNKGGKGCGEKGLWCFWVCLFPKSIFSYRSSPFGMGLGLSFPCPLLTAFFFLGFPISNNCVGMIIMLNQRFRSTYLAEVSLGSWVTILKWAAPGVCHRMHSISWIK